ncbi:MAG: hypothetical protein K8E24_008220 [Methanobacterium paludis]|nr:hypothetical protein [Methanobacterium paludis]
MDWIQISIAIFIPLVVSIFAWTLTYIIPYIRPNWVSNTVIKVTKNNPKDPIEIGLIINQFSKYDDWKRLTASKRIKQMFTQKVREIEDNKELEGYKLENEEGIITAFNDIILYIDYPHSKSKKDKLTYRLALGLSDHDKSHETLIKLIKEIQGQIYNKDYKEWEKRMNIWG